MFPSDKRRAVAKTLLLVWPAIEEERRVLNGKIDYYCSRGMNPAWNTEQLMEKIAEVSAKSAMLQNLKKEIDGAVAQLPEKLQRVINAYYTRRKFKEKVVSAGFAETTFLRHLDLAINAVSLRLDGIGINAFTWQNLLANFTLIRSIFEKQKVKRAVEN
ncbi:MAG: hypothetical protein LBH47_02420 [Christensenellaceae bacterium]|jgi:hypothetical protein|nr:hypothetical protein [Christensenellaceae bacterium]